MRDVVFEASGATMRGWFVPSQNGAAVVLVHGSSSNRADVAREARVLANAGFGALLFDRPGHGESDGRVTYGSSERGAIRAAVQFVAAQPDVDPARIGALGISAGATILATAAAENAAIRTLALVSPFADSDAQTRSEFASWGIVTQWPAIWVDRALMPDGPLRALDAVRSLGGRSLLVIAGDHDPVVPRWMSEELYDAANARKTLLVLPSTGHANFNALEPGPYGEHIVRWFRDELAPGVSASGTP
jgi:alpha-beta hydrolase superfamily lysophospholipase